MRCGGLRVWTRSLTRPVSRTACLSTGHLGDFTGAVWSGRPHRPSWVGGCQARVRCVCACAFLLRRVGRAGLPGPFWCASPFPVAIHGALLVCPAPSGLGLPCLWFFLRLFFCFCAPRVCGVPCFPALSALGRGVLWSAPPLFCFSFALFFLPLPAGVFFFCLFFCLFFFRCPVFFLSSSPSFLFFFALPCCAGCAVPGWCVLGCGACWCVFLRALCCAGGRCSGGQQTARTADECKASRQEQSSRGKENKQKRGTQPQRQKPHNTEKGGGGQQPQGGGQRPGGKHKCSESTQRAEQRESSKIKKRKGGGQTARTAYERKAGRAEQNRKKEKKRGTQRHDKNRETQKGGGAAATREQPTARRETQKQLERTES